MKLRPFVAILFLANLVLPVAQAQSGFFGNVPNGTSAGNIGRAGLGLGYRQEIAISFTPLKNIELTDVTVWLTGFNGANGQTLSAFVASDPSDAPYYPPYFSPATPLQPSGLPQNFLGNFGLVAPNDGSFAAFTLTAGNYGLGNDFMPSSVTLFANMAYWLVIDVDGNYGSTTFASLAGGDLPVGNAIYNGMCFYDPVYGVGSTLDLTRSPAFVINSGLEPSAIISPVPEPSTLALTALGVMILTVCRFGQKTRCPAVCRLSRSGRQLQTA